MSVEDYVLQMSFFFGGFCAIVHTAAVMCRSVVKIYLNQKSHHQSSLESSKPAEPAAQGKCYKEENGSIYSNEHAVNSCKILNKDIPLHSYANCNDSSSHQQHASNQITQNPAKDRSNLKLISILFLSCALESVCSVVFDYHTKTDSVISCCNISASTDDCLLLNPGLILHRRSVDLFVSKLLLCVLLTFPLTLLSTKHCFTNWPRRLASAFLFVLSILLSRCFAFFFFPGILSKIDDQRGFEFERLLSTWIVCFSMCLGVKFTKDITTQQSDDIIIDKPNEAELSQKQLSHHGNQTQPRTQRQHQTTNKKHSDKGNTVPRSSKRFTKKSPSHSVSTIDGFIPCVVLMKNQGTELYKTYTNIGTMPKAPRTRRRASLDVIKENNKVNDARKWSDIIERRRTSLPAILASSKRKAVMSSVLVDSSTMSDVQNTLDGYSSDPSQAEHIIERLRKLLRPYKSDHIKPRQVVWLHDTNNEVSDDDVQGPRHVTQGGKRSSRCSDWSSSNHRDIFSTTTTATGLPTEEPAPEKPIRLPLVAKTPISSPFESSKGSPTCDPKLPGMGRRGTFPFIKRSVTSFSSSLVGSRKPTSSDYESGDPDDSPARSFSTNVRSKSVNEVDECENNPPPQFYPHHPHADEHLDSSVLPLFPDCDGKIVEEDESCRDDGSVFFSDYQEELLSSVYDWNFQIFDLAEQTPCVLSQMAFKLFQDTGLFSTFRIPKQEFVKYMRALESGYRQIPYHNRIHAADVLHGCWFLSTQDIPGFQEYYPALSSDSSDSDSGTGASQTRQVNNTGHGSLAQSIPALELMSLYLAAAMHDYDHPGRTNAFLVDTRHPLAILYNDRSVLENHHASASWELLYSNRNFDFLKNLTTAEWKRLRFLIVESILATDLKKHFDILSQFTSKSQRTISTSDDDSDSNSTLKSGINWSADEDRLLVCQMVIKLADIGGPAKMRNLHITWTKAICEEFFIQGDEERELNVPVSPFMDREQPQVAELQRKFINSLIKPIVCSMHKTGILAGAVPEHTDDATMGLRQSLLLEQLKDNLNFWKSNTYSSGQEEMTSAFKLALPVHLRLDRRDQNSKPHSVTLHRPTAVVPSQACRCNDESDDVFKSSQPHSLLSPRDLNVTSSNAFTSSRLRRPPPKIAVSQVEGHK